MNLQFNAANARKMNSRIVEVVSMAMAKEDAAEPVEFCTNMLHKAIAGSPMDKVMAVPMLAAILRYSLRSVSKEKFITEFRIALNEYTDFMASESDRIGSVEPSDILSALMKLG